MRQETIQLPETSLHQLRSRWGVLLLVVAGKLMGNSKTAWWANEAKQSFRRVTWTTASHDAIGWQAEQQIDRHIR